MKKSFTGDPRFTVCPFVAGCSKKEGGSNPAIPAEAATEK